MVKRIRGKIAQRRKVLSSMVKRIRGKIAQRRKELSSMVKRIQIPGSERFALPKAKKTGPAKLDNEITVTVYIRRGSGNADLTEMMKNMAERPFSLPYLSRSEFAEQYGIEADAVKRVEKFAREYNLEVKETNTASGTILLCGTVENFNKAFKVELSEYEHPDFKYRGRTGPIEVPEELSDIVLAVLGLDNRPQTRPHFRVLNESRTENFTRSLASRNSYTPVQIAQLYNFPQNVDCSGQCIGIIELGGGYNEKDLEQYFSKLGVPKPQVTAVGVNGGKNAPEGNPDGADGEVMLDIEVAAAIAPGAKIAVYFAPNTDAGFLNAVTTAVHDKKNNPSVISISWGSAEANWTSQAIQAMNQAFHDAAALGVTICSAAGDNGSSDGVTDGSVHVDFPASSPYVLACGGTKLQGSGQTISSEVVWNEQNHGATGGGVSDVFGLPDWQSNAKVPVSANAGGKAGRGVPDIAGNADPVTGYEVLVDGQFFVIGGTSAVAPLWAGLVAIFNQQLGRPVGFLNPALYQIGQKGGGFRDITNGNNDTSGNGSYPSSPGWDACTGWGSPNGVNLLQALQAMQPAGV
jgi:kumamolisin